jgi:hypothetical protein
MLKLPRCILFVLLLEYVSHFNAGSKYSTNEINDEQSFHFIQLQTIEICIQIGYTVKAL